MQQTPLGLVVSTSDLIDFLECEHRTNSNALVSQGAFTRPTRHEPRNEFLAAEGLSHERRFLEQLRATGRQVVEIGASPSRRDDLLDAVARTEAAMRDGAEVIYQGAFFNAPWIGHPDFLVLTENGYEVIDTKLATGPRANAIIQIAAYSAHVARLQGREPELMHLRTGDNRTLSFPVRDSSALYRRLATEYEAWLAKPPTTYPEPVDSCVRCDFLTMCDTQWRTADDLSQLTGATRQFRERLQGHGIERVRSLAAMPAEVHVPGVSDATLSRQQDQARMQVLKRQRNAPQYEFFAPERGGSGLSALPEPTPHDVYFDLEGAPENVGGGHEFLWGIHHDSATGLPRYRHRWAFDDADELRAFTETVDFFTNRYARHPDMHVYHYGAYETVALRRLAQRYGTHGAEVEALIRAGVFVDLLPVMRQSLHTSEGSYSLKAMEPFYNFERSGVVLEAGDSLALFHAALSAATSPEGQLRRGVMRYRLAPVLDYNTADLDSLRRCHEFAEGGRARLVEAGVAMERPTLGPPERTEAQQQADAEVADLYRALMVDIPLIETERSAEQQAQWVLAQMLEWHRREARPEWDEHFKRLRMTEPELFDDLGAISGLRLIQETPATVDRSYIYRYRFDPTQEFSIRIGDTVLDPRTGKSAGTVEAIDESAGVISLRRGKQSKAEHPDAVIAPTPIDTKGQRAALLELARSVLETGIDGPGPYRAARDLLLRRMPAIEGLPEGVPLGILRAVPERVAVKAAHDLSESCLVVQGPPGTGKTSTAAAIAIDAIRAGRTVAVTGSSHRIITGLVDEIDSLAARKLMDLNIVQRGPAHEVSRQDTVHIARSNEDVLKAMQDGHVHVVAGTSWLFSNPALRDRFDVVVVDEAGRLSLADALATAGAGKNLVLIGDQRQLEQPIQGSHPTGTDLSALEYYVDADTVAPERGVLLDTTHRMHPAITRFVSSTVYNGRLRSAPDCARHAVLPAEGIGGAGNRFVFVEHQNNVNSSPQEAATVAKLYQSLLGRAWQNRGWEMGVIGPKDIIISAPTNAQAAAIRAALRRVDPELASQARVGTTDRMQGQEAPIQIYSLAASSPERVARSFDFQYSLNRLNVAVTRARALSFVVASPRLLTPACHTPEQIRMANALNAYVESSDVFDADLQPAEVPTLSRHAEPIRQPLVGRPYGSSLIRDASQASTLNLSLNHR